MTYSAEVLADSPVGYWRLDDVSGTVAEDATANNRDGTYVNAPTLAAASMLPVGDGTAVALDGTSQRISIAHHSDFNDSASGFTFEAWVKLDNPDADALQIVADKTNLSTSNNQWVIYWDNRSGINTHTLVFRWSSAGNGIWNSWVGTVARDALAAGGHLVFTLAPSSRVTLYWNGAEVSSTTSVSAAGGATTQPLMLGARSDGSANFLDGTLDEVAIYDKVLTLDRVVAHYLAADPNAVSVLSGKAIWLRAKDQAGADLSAITALTDMSGRGLDLYGGNATVAEASTPSGGKSIRGGSSAYGFTGNHPHTGQTESEADEVTVSSNYSASRSYVAWSPTSSILTTASWWASGSGMPQWWQVKLKTAKVVTEYTLRVNAVGATRRPKDWTFEGSNDGTSWTTLDTQTAYVFSGYSGTFAFTNTTAYLYYRVHITANNGDNITGLSQVELTGVNLDGVQAQSELWAVLKSDGPALHPIDFFSSGDTRYFFSGGDVYEGFGSSGRLIYTPTLDITQWRLMRVTHDGTTRRVYLDGVEQASDSAASTANMWSWVADIGAASTNLAEILVRTAVSTPSEVLALTEYFNEEHGLSVPLGDPETTVDFPVSAGLGFAVPIETTVDLPVSAGFEVEIVVAQTSVDMPVSVGLGVAPQPELGLPVSAALDFVAIQVLESSVDLPVSAGLSFTAEKAGETSVALPVSVGLGVEAFVSLTSVVDLPVSVGFAVEIVTPDTSVDLPVAVGLEYAAEQVVPLSLDLSVNVGLSFQVAALGSIWMPYEVAESGSQAVDFSIVPTAPEITAPAVADGDVDSNSLWLALASTASQTVTVSLAAAFAGGVEVWTGAEGEGPDELVFLGSSVTPTAVDAPISAGQRVYLRVHPTSGLETGAGTITWSVAPRPAEGLLQFSVADEIAETPGWLLAMVASATPLAQLDFSVDGGAVIFSADADDVGVCETGVLLPELTVGAHTLMVTDTVSGQTGSDTFTVLAELPAPDVIPPDVGPGAPPEVARWIFTDPAPAGEVYSFPTNPTSMSTPHPARVITTDHSVYPGGTTILWEGISEPTDWQVQGKVLTQAHYEAFERFYALQRRFWVTDHLGRAWLVVFNSLEFTDLRDATNPWSHTYVAKFLIVGGPVQVS